MAVEAVAALEARGVRAGYGDAEILQGVDLRLLSREIVSVIGPNGAGKSTLLKAMFGLLPVRAGDVLLQGRSIANAPVEEVVRAGLAYVPQTDNVFPRLTVRENLEMGAFLAADGTHAALEQVLSVLPALAEKLDARVLRLSGGQRQMVAIGRALMARPAAMLLDEPTAGLAPLVADELFRALRSLAAHGTPILIVEQNARRALALSDRGYVLDMGRNRYEGTGPELLADPDVGRLYLGG